MGKLIESIYLLSGNLGITIFFLSLIMSVIGMIPRVLISKNRFIKYKYAKETYKIKKDYDDPEEQLKKIGELYKEDKYIYVLPEIFQLGYSIIHIMIFTTILNYKNTIPIVLETKQSFLFIDNILTPNIYITLPILCAIIQYIGSNLFNLKNIFHKNNLMNLIGFGLSIIIYITYGKLFGCLYLIFILGIYFFRIIQTLILRKITIQTIEYQKEYETFLQSVKNE